MAGLAFAWSPALVTRSMAHFSLMAAAPLAVFLLVLLVCSERKRWGWREAVALGLTVCWAALTDAYYGIYCLLLGGLFLASRAVRMSRVPMDPARSVRVTLEVMIAATAILVVAVALSGGWQFAVFAQPVSIHSLYTPVLLLTVLVGARVAWHYRVTLSAARADVGRSLVVVGFGVATSVLLSPLLYAVVRRVMRSGIDNAVPLWRSSPAAWTCSPLAAEPQPPPGT